MNFVDSGGPHLAKRRNPKDPIKQRSPVSTFWPVIRDAAVSAVYMLSGDGLTMHRQAVYHIDKGTYEV